jgi:acyl dehydratase
VTVDAETRQTIDPVSIGDQLGPIAIPVTLQRLVMEAGANRDFSLIHHDRDVARATGAPDAYMNTFFIAGMFERLLREWIGPRGRIRKITNLRMQVFNCVGDMAVFTGQVERIETASNEVSIALRCETEKGVAVTAEATVVLPGS